MPELSAAEKFLTDWTSAYTEADRPDRLASDTSGESCLADAELAGILKEDVVKAADGDLNAYLGNALKAKRILREKGSTSTERLPLLRVC